MADDGTVFALTSAGFIYGDALLKISPQGDLLDEKSIPGFDLVLSDATEGLYIAGGDIKYCNLDLELQWAIDPIGWCASSVDTCSDGTAWVAERRHPQLDATRNALHHVSLEGSLLQTVMLSFSPFCVRVDKQDNSLYVVSDQLYKYDPTGSLEFAAPLDGIGGWSLAFDPYRTGIWIGTFSDVRLLSFEGATLLVVDAFPGQDQKYVACPLILAKYAGGTGEPNDPYRIATAADLTLLGRTPEDYDKHFILCTDIDLDPNLLGGNIFDRAVIAMHTGTEPWPFEGTPFTGVFDGNGHSISHLTIKGDSYLGLFGRLGFGSEVRNLAILDANIMGTGDYMGVLAETNRGAISRCCTSGAVSE